jgi:transposase
MREVGSDDVWRPGFVGRIEVREGRAGRRTWPDAVKGRIVRESLEPGATVNAVAYRHGIAPQQLTTWRRLARQGRLALPDDPRDDDDIGFAALVVTDEVTQPTGDAAGAPPTETVEIVAHGVTVRLPGATPAVRIAEIAAALGTRR